MHHHHLLLLLLGAGRHRARRYGWLLRPRDARTSAIEGRPRKVRYGGVAFAFVHVAGRNTGTLLQGVLEMNHTKLANDAAGMAK